MGAHAEALVEFVEQLVLGAAAAAVDRAWREAELEKFAAVDELLRATPARCWPPGALECR